MVESSEVVEVDVKVILVGHEKTGKTEFMKFWGERLDKNKEVSPNQDKISHIVTFDNEKIRL